MSSPHEADRHLLAQIASGDRDGWANLVTRYQGRLLAFARSRLKRREEAEDLVQDTFIAFLESIKRFREGASIETYLFTILRRKLIDAFRGRALKTCFIADVMSSRGGETGSSSVENNLEGDASTPSTYVRNDEADRRLRELLGQALDTFVGRLKKAENFRDLQIVELLFYAQVRNKEAADAMGMDEKAIGLIKHRAVRELQANVLAADVASRRGEVAASTWPDSNAAATMLSEVWEEHRPTCPKRSTIGRFVLGTLEPAWKSYVGFHLEKLGCEFCGANLRDIKAGVESPSKSLQTNVIESTAGFFR